MEDSKQVTQVGGVEFAGFSCDVIQTSYHNGTKALILVDNSDEDYGIPVATESVNIAGVSEYLPENQVALKTYSENEGILEALTSARIVRDTGRVIGSGYVTCPVVEILT